MRADVAAQPDRLGGWAQPNCWRAVSQSLADAWAGNGITECRSVNFDLLVPTGLYELTWDNSAPLGFTNSGDLVSSAQW